MKTYQQNTLIKNLISYMVILALLVLPVPVSAEDLNGMVYDGDVCYYYENNVMQTSCMKRIDGLWYYFQEDGKMLDNDCEAELAGDSGSVYYVRANPGGDLYCEDWYSVPDSYPRIRYYYDENCHAVKGPFILENEYYLFSDHGMLLCNVSEYVWNDQIWHTDEYGRLLEGAGGDSGNGNPDEGGNNEGDNGENEGDSGSGNENDSGGNSNGSATGNTGDNTGGNGNSEGSGNDGNGSTAGENGQGSADGNEGEDLPIQKNGWSEDEDGIRYYVNGFPLASSIVLLEEKYYCFDEYGYLLVSMSAMVYDTSGTLRGIRAKTDGSLYRDEVYHDEYSGAEYRYGTDCFAYFGFYTFADGVHYFFPNGRMAVGESFQYEDHFYYADAQGNIMEGRFFDEEGNILRNICVVYNDMLFGCYDSGEAERIVGNGFFQNVYRYRAVYLHNSLILKNDFAEVDGELYYFGPDGDLQTGLFYIGAERHLSSSRGIYLGTAPFEGWNTINGERYYIKNGALFSEGKHTVDWKECYFNEDGMLIHDCRYGNIQLDENGQAIQEGWVYRTDGSYYIDSETHEIVRNKEISINNHSYYFDSDGLMVTGIITINGEQRNYGTDGIRIPVPKPADNSEDNVTDEDPDKDYIPVNETSTAQTDEGNFRSSQSPVKVNQHDRQNDRTESQKEENRINAEDIFNTVNPMKMLPGLYVLRYGVWVHKTIPDSKRMTISFSANGKYAWLRDTGEPLKQVLLVTNSETLYFDEQGLLSRDGLRRTGHLLCLIHCQNSYPDQTITILKR